jgi:hypothetical protein
MTEAPHSSPTPTADAASDALAPLEAKLMELNLEWDILADVLKRCRDLPMKLQKIPECLALARAAERAEHAARDFRTLPIGLFMEADIEELILRFRQCSTELLALLSQAESRPAAPDAGANTESE